MTRPGPPPPGGGARGEETGAAGRLPPPGAAPAAPARPGAGPGLASYVYGRGLPFFDSGSACSVQMTLPSAV